MRTNLKEAEPREADELAILEGDLSAANESKRRADEALAGARSALEDLEQRVTRAPRGDLDVLLRDRLIAREKIVVFEADVLEAEAARIEAGKRLSKLRRARAEEAARVAIEETGAKVGAATKAAVDAAHSLFKELEVRLGVVQAAEGIAASARAYGIAPAPIESTKELLARISKETGIVVSVGLHPTSLVRF